MVTPGAMLFGINSNSSMNSPAPLTSRFSIPAPSKYSIFTTLAHECAETLYVAAAFDRTMDKPEPKTSEGMTVFAIAKL